MPIFRLLGEVSEVFTLQKQHIAPMAVKFGMQNMTVGIKFGRVGAQAPKLKILRNFGK